MSGKRKAKRLLKQRHTGAGIAGAGGGTMLAFVANNLPANSPWKPWLVLIAPSLSVAIGVFGAWASNWLEDYVQSKRKKLLFDRVKSTIESALNKPATSNTHKDELRAQLEKVEKLQFQSDFELLVKEAE